MKKIQLIIFLYSQVSTFNNTVLWRTGEKVFVYSELMMSILSPWMAPDPYHEYIDSHINCNVAFAFEYFLKVDSIFVL